TARKPSDDSPLRNLVRGPAVEPGLVGPPTAHAMIRRDCLRLAINRGCDRSVVERGPPVPVFHDEGTRSRSGPMIRAEGGAKSRAGVARRRLNEHLAEIGVFP